MNPSGTVGDVAQMVERALSMREVMGSMPIFSTFLLDSIVVSISACHADDPGSIPGRGGLINFWGMKATEMALFTKN